MTDSPDRARQLGRSDLTAKPGESFSAWVERVRRIAVIDPELADQERHRMEADDQRRREAAGRSREHAMGALRWVLGSLAALGVSALLFFLAGLSAWIVVACAIASAASLPGGVTHRRPVRFADRRGWPLNYLTGTLVPLIPASRRIRMPVQPRASRSLR